MGFVGVCHKIGLGILRRKNRRGALRLADGDDLIFDRLAHHFQDARAKLGQLVQEKHAAMGEGDLCQGAAASCL